MTETREIVVPGEAVGSAEELRPGMNTYIEGQNIYALRLGVKTIRGDRVNVISLSGRYEPMRGDMVIGTIAEVGPSNWYVNIGAANDVGMHVNDVPWRVEFGETSKYLAVGDTVLLKIVHVDEMKKAQVSMKDRQCRKLTGGLILDVAPTKVPRIVGRQGSMITMIKDATNVRIFVGQNGHIWIDGEADDVQLALEALRKIEDEAHTTGLTDRMKAWLEERRPSASRPQRAAPPEEEVSEEEAPREERPRREREDRPRRRFEEEGRPPRREERPPRRFEEDRPRERPMREADDRPRERPMRDADERPPMRERPMRETEERPRRRFEDEERPRRAPTDEDRPLRRRLDDADRAPPPRRFEERPRSFEERAPPRRPMAEDEDAPPRRRMASDEDEEDRPRDRQGMAREGGGAPRGYGEGDGRRSGGGRRRGGRGRGRGGSRGGGE